MIEEYDRREATDFRYVTGDGPAAPVPLEVTPEDNEVCKAYHARSAPKISGTTSVLDLKMVQVSSGSVLWAYRHIENVSAADASSVVRFGAQARRSYRTRRPWWPWLVVGGGLAIMAAGQLEVGGVVTGLGAIGTVALPRSTTPIDEPRYEQVSDVLCRRAHLQDARTPGRTAERPRDRRSSTFRSDTKVSAKDLAEERRRDLIRSSVQVFMRQLTATR